MAQIAQEDQARRLARAIASDIKLYNEDKIRAAGADVRSAIAGEIEEGRRLFVSRAVSAMWTIYEQVVAEFFGGAVASPAPAPPAAASEIDESAETVELALAAAKAKVPAGAQVIEEQRWESKRESKEIEAATEADARALIPHNMPEGAKVVNFELVREPKGGFLGIGREDGSWRLTFAAPCRVKIFYREV
jgi:hypothetical protein